LTSQAAFSPSSCRSPSPALFSMEPLDRVLAIGSNKKIVTLRHGMLFVAFERFQRQLHPRTGILPDTDNTRPPSLLNSLVFGCPLKNNLFQDFAGLAIHTSRTDSDSLLT